MIYGLKTVKKLLNDKELTEVKGVIDRTSWYKQAADCNVFYVSSPSLGVIDQMDYPVFYCDGREYSAYFDLKNASKEAKIFFENPEKIDVYYKKFSEISAKLGLLFKKGRVMDFNKNDLSSLQLFIKEMDKLDYELWFRGYLVDKFDPHGSDMLDNKIKKCDIKLDFEELHLLIHPRKLNFVERSNLKLFKIAKKLEGRNIDEKELLLMLRSVAKEYYYVQNSWKVVKALKENDFLKPLKDIIKLPQKRINSTISKYGDQEEEIKKKCEQLIRKHKISKNLQNLFHLFRVLALIRDERKECVLISNHFYELFLRRFVNEFDINYDLICKAIPQELIDISSKEKIISFLPELRERKKGMLFGHSNYASGDILLSGESAKQLTNMLHTKMLEQYDKIKGVVASKAAKKIKGRVKVVLGETHFSKFEKGDILVAVMTRPEYVPLMRKAKAIITDEGGLTCHAAIVSRELKIPCIVGAQIATKKLVDGDIVLIDAEKGVIRRVEKEKYVKICPKCGNTNIKIPPAGLDIRMILKDYCNDCKSWGMFPEIKESKIEEFRDRLRKNRRK